MFNIDEVESFVIYDENENEVECKVIMAFHSEINHNDYIVFTDSTVDEDDNIQIQAARYDPEAEELELLAIEGEEEQKIVGEAIDELLVIEQEEIEIENEE